MRRVTVFKSILWSILGMALASGITRMLFGLGAVTNQGDATPWGLWKGFNVVPGIALAAGGFVVTAIIYVVRREDYHRYAKISVLLALLGYLTAATALVVELGLPWMVWHPIIYWQHHSALFEVSWCVMLYLTVLFLEFLPVPLEEMGWLAALRRFLTKYKLVLVVLGIMISTLHQSSLGTMFLITPEKLHPLWYSSLLPILFFISAVAVGPLMVTVGVLTISHLYRKPIEHDKLSNLGLFSLAVLVLFAAIRMIDSAVTGDLGMAFNGTWESNIFLIEMALIFVIPVVFLSVRSLRRSPAGLWTACGSAVIGIVLHRANIAGIMLVRTGSVYVPTIYEVLISLGIISAAILAFLFCVERFKMWETKWDDPREKTEAAPEFDRAAQVWLGTPRIASRTMLSFILVVSVALGFAIMPSKRIRSEGVRQVAVAEARGVDTMYVDGNSDAWGVVFDHAGHIEREGGDAFCVACHHMNFPEDQSTGCYACHQSMYTPSDAFRHDWHADPAGARLACTSCHPADQDRTAETVVACTECHQDLVPAGAPIEVKQYLAPSYVDAMHGICVSCHEQRTDDTPERAELALCPTCHAQPRPTDWPEQRREKFLDTTFNRVMLPKMAVTHEKGIDPK